MKRRTRDFDQYLFHGFADDSEHTEETEDLLFDSLKLVGWVVLYFNQLEKMVDSAICEAIFDRSDSVGLLVIHGMPYASKVDLYGRLCDELHSCVDVPIPEYEGLVDELKEAGRLRNLVVHAHWNSTDAEGYTYVRLKVANGRIQQEYAQLTPDSMEQVLARINAAVDRFDAYLQERDLIRGRL